ncbi:MAG: adenylate cyclase [Actinomycetota bacterium]|jgi:class 3 adenylate cyclase
MTPERDWSPFVAAGLLDGDSATAEARKALLEFLLEHGCTVDEMVTANDRGRLFGLAGDRALRPGAFTRTLSDVARDTGADETMVRRLWRSLGLLGWDSDAPVASHEDVEAFQTVMLASEFVGEAMTLEMARSVGAGLSRIADAVQSLGRTVSPTGSVATSGDELETARFWAAAAPVVASLGAVLDVLFRHHYEVARWHFERSDSIDLMLRGRARLAVAFVDMSGFTSAAEQLGATEFEQLVKAFMTDVSDTVHDRGGRVVKFVGDAAMFVAPDALTLATITRGLVAEQVRENGLALHAGLAYGEVLTRDGDCFGSAVNLAARLAALAGAGSVLASADVGRVLAEAGWEIDFVEPQTIRGFAEPVPTCRVVL